MPDQWGIIVGTNHCSTDGFLFQGTVQNSVLVGPIAVKLRETSLIRVAEEN